MLRRQSRAEAYSRIGQCHRVSTVNHLEMRRDIVITDKCLQLRFQRLSSARDIRHELRASLLGRQFGHRGLDRRRGIDVDVGTGASASRQEKGG